MTTPPDPADTATLPTRVQPVQGHVGRDAVGAAPSRMYLGLVPWVSFGVLTHRLGSSAAGAAAVSAVALVVVVAWQRRPLRHLTLVELSGLATFTPLAVVALVGGPAGSAWVADFGRAASAAALALVMLASVQLVPFTEQYARESVPREYWTSPVFRAVNRRISAAWGAAVLLIALAHALDGAVDPASAPRAGGRPLDLLLNGGVPVLLVAATLAYGKHLTTAAGSARLGPAPR